MAIKEAPPLPPPRARLRGPSRLLLESCTGPSPDRWTLQSLLSPSRPTPSAQAITAALQKALKADSIVDPVTGDGPLHTLCAQGHTDMALLLLLNDANPRSENATGVTPLHAACRSGNPATVDLLANWGANVDAVDGHNLRCEDYLVGVQDSAAQAEIRRILDAKREKIARAKVVWDEIATEAAAEEQQRKRQSKPHRAELTLPLVPLEHKTIISTNDGDGALPSSMTPLRDSPASSPFATIKRSLSLFAGKYKHHPHHHQQPQQQAEFGGSPLSKPGVTDAGPACASSALDSKLVGHFGAQMAEEAKRELQRIEAAKQRLRRPENVAADRIEHTATTSMHAGSPGAAGEKMPPRGGLQVLPPLPPPKASESRRVVPPQHSPPSVPLPPPPAMHRAFAATAPSALPAVITPFASHGREPVSPAESAATAFRRALPTPPPHPPPSFTARPPPPPPPQTGKGSSPMAPSIPPRPPPKSTVPYVQQQQQQKDKRVPHERLPVTPPVPESAVLESA